jgi:DNA-binding MarR family transcriptional regulator
LTLELVCALERFARLWQSTSFTTELAPVQWAALRFMARVAAERRTQAELAAYSGVVASSASRTVGSLSRKGLVAVRPGGRGRQTLVELTEDGHRLLARDPLRQLTATLAGLEREEKARLIDCFNRFAEIMVRLEFCGDAAAAES